MKIIIVRSIVMQMTEHRRSIVMQMMEHRRSIVMQMKQMEFYHKT